VTLDESQVSVGGILALDQFWDFNRMVEGGAPRRSGDRRISLILRACGPNKGFLGFM
jgi:hypothetical protein